jgi:hypothetical protein
MFGDLFQLRWLGLLCPCLQKEEDRTALQALEFVSGRRILWIRSSESSSGFSLGNFFRSSVVSISNTSSSGGGPQLAFFKLVDNADGQAEILVDPNVASSMMSDEEAPNNNNNNNNNNTPADPAAAPSIQLTIKLRRVDRVSLDKTEEIVFFARPTNNTTNTKNKSAKELLRFSVCNKDDTTSVIPTDERNMFLHHMAVLVEWDRQRRDPYDDDEDEDQPNFLQARAQKAAHFAQRELELQTTKRERDKRKAKLVEASGGLKYTALAMAGMKA